jgi:putative transposase
MPRIARTVIPNIPYHLTQRGNNRQDVFFTVDNRKNYLDWLAIYSSRFKFDIQAYCIMSNHVHIVGIPRYPDSMARTVQVLHVRHAQSINREKNWHGHVWHQRYFAAPLDDSYFWLAMRYVEQNPVRAGMVAKAEDYLWSSAGYHCGLRDDQIIKHDISTQGMFDDWITKVNEIPDDEAIECLRRRTFKGLPCGDSRFVKRISSKTGVNYTDRDRGRPRNPHE